MRLAEIDNSLAFRNPRIELDMFFGESSIQHLGKLLLSVIERLYIRARGIKDHRHLRNLDDRLLRDIGLSPVDVEMKGCRPTSITRY